MTALLLANICLTIFIISQKNQQKPLWIYLVGAGAVLLLILAAAEETCEHPSPISITAVVATLAYLVSVLFQALKGPRVGGQK